MSNIVTWYDLKCLSDDAIANCKPGDFWPRMLGDITRAWGKDLDALVECQRQLAEARAALKRADDMFADARWDSVLEWRERHAAALKAARETSNGNP